MLLESEWDEADENEDWSLKATVKIFSNEQEYNDYQNENQDTWTGSQQFIDNAFVCK